MRDLTQSSHVIQEPATAVRSEYSFKSVNFKEEQYDFAAYEIDYDQDIYWGNANLKG